VDDVRLIVIRGNSGSGKSSVAEGIRTACSERVAWVEQDHLRRIVFKEMEEPDGANIPAIEQLAGLALSRGFHTVVEGIMATARYGEMLARLARQHAGPSYFYYLDIPFEETVRRHAGRPKATAFDHEEMRDWYRPRDLLTSPSETIIDESSTLDETVSRILTDSGLS
jgi:predicted kinase